MKLVFAIKKLSNAVGGAERVLCMICSELVTRGHKVTIITCDSGDPNPFYALDHRVIVRNLSLGNAADKASLFITLKRMYYLRRVIRQESPDVVIGFMHSMFVPLSLALYKTGIPVVGSEHIVPDHYKDKRLELILFKLSSYFIDVFTVLSSSIKSTYPYCIRRKMTVISNPVVSNTGREKTEYSYDNAPLILNVGRLTPQKDHSTLIDAFRIVHQSFPGCRLKIIGDGEMREEIEKKINNYQLNNVISLPGVTKDIEVEYERADIFVLSSKYESFGLVTAEAMSYGLPVIGFSDCLGTNELISNGETGLLVPATVNRAEALAHGIQSVLNDKLKREKLGRNGKRFIQHTFSIKYIVDQWESVLVKLAIKKRSL